MVSDRVVCCEDESVRMINVRLMSALQSSELDRDRFKLTEAPWRFRELTLTLKSFVSPSRVNRN
jgi:hypothetical protein